jgi:large subunit ribosomal protein L25
MTSTEKLIASKREKLGTIASNKLRKEGLVPGNVYGLSKDPVAISTSLDTITDHVFSGHKVLDCEIDGSTEITIIKDVQWDTFGIRIEHFDLLRIDPDKKITVEVEFLLRGNAAGVISGGNLIQNMRSVTVECLAVNVPDKIKVRINDVEIGGSILVSDLEAPEGVTFVTPESETVLHIVEPVEIEDEDLEAEAGPAEPELIGRKEEDGDGEG